MIAVGGVQTFDKADATRLAGVADAWLARPRGGMETRRKERVRRVSDTPDWRIFWEARVAEYGGMYDDDVLLARAFSADYAKAARRMESMWIFKVERKRLRAASQERLARRREK